MVLRTPTTPAARRGRPDLLRLAARRRLVAATLRRMRVYLSVDMEGIAGVSHPGPTRRTDTEYPAAADLMVGETNAAIAGAVAAGATDILVNDSHGGMYNLRPEAVDPAARLLQGQKPWSMVAGAASRRRRPAFDVALFVGYHARAGHPTGTIAHTYTGGPVETRLNGRPTGEYGFNALVARRVGHPRRPGRGRRRARRRGRGLAALGRASRGQGGLRLERGRLAPSRAGARGDPGRRGAGRRAGARRRAPHPRGRATGRDRGRLPARRWRPTTPRSCPAPSGPAIGRSAIRAPIR